VWRRPVIRVLDAHCLSCHSWIAGKHGSVSFHLFRSKDRANAAPVRLACLHRRFCPHTRTQIPCFVLSSFALVGFLVTAEPVFADSLAATASDHAQATATAFEQPESLAPVWSSPDLPAPASRAGLGKTITPLVWPG
jgi:hypothetical protein